MSNNGNGKLIDSNAPLWAKILFQFGAPTFFSAVMLAALLGWLTTPLMKKLEAIESAVWQQTTMIRGMCYAFNQARDDVKIICEPWKEENR